MHIKYPGKTSTSSKFVDACIKGNFVSDYVFNLSQNTLSPLEINKSIRNRIKVFSDIFIIKDRDISDFSRKMRCKWFFRKERQENVSETSEFKRKYTMNPPNGAPALEQFLSQREKDIL